MEPLDVENLGCFLCPHIQITHSFCSSPFLLPGFCFVFSRKFHTNVSYRPFYSSSPPEGSIGNSQTCLVPTWVPGYVGRFHILCLSPELTRQASQGWGKGPGKMPVTSSASRSMSSPFTHPINSAPLVSNPEPCSYCTLRKFFREMVIT